MNPGLALSAFCYSPSTSRPLLSAFDDEKNSERYFLKGGYRIDGRRREEMRKMYMRTHPASNASGSAFVSIGDTKVCCAVCGPSSFGRGTLHDRGCIRLEYKYTPFARRTPSAKSTTNATPHDHISLQQAIDSIVQLHKYPKAVIDISVVVIEDDGGTLAAALTCVGLALAEAGIECHDVVAGSSAYAFSYRTPENGVCHAVALDLSAEEYQRFSEEEDFTEVHVGLCPALGAVCCLHCSGPLIGGPSGEQLFSLCEATGIAIGREMRRCLLKSFTKKNSLQMN